MKSFQKKTSTGEFSEVKLGPFKKTGELSEFGSFQQRNLNWRVQ